MIRTCDGTDPNLIRRVGDQDVPCYCGARFDDVVWMTIWPHQEVCGTRTLADRDEAYSPRKQATRVPGLLMLDRAIDNTARAIIAAENAAGSGTRSEWSEARTAARLRAAEITDEVDRLIATRTAEFRAGGDPALTPKAGQEGGPPLYDPQAEYDEVDFEEHVEDATEFAAPVGEMVEAGPEVWVVHRSPVGTNRAYCGAVNSDPPAGMKKRSCPACERTVGQYIP